ncbi:MAG: hypothetical protein RLZZ324_362 [Candidatus Parcubacteria bacterium]|jgi:GT2 family glycosyltransferase
MAHVAVSIVAWNSMQHLPEALASLAEQTFPNLSVIVVDNASQDGTEKYVREEYSGVMLLRNVKNLGFARAHNQAIAYARSRLKNVNGELYVLVMNPDVVLTPTYIAEVVAAMERRPDMGSAVGRIMRMARSQEETKIGGEPTDEIDTVGLVPRRSRRFMERGEGEHDGSGTLYARSEEIFGVSGALAMYRLSALDAVALGPKKDEVFDEDFFAYKEDVDLAWRLRSVGFPAWYVPTAVAYHYRTAKGAGGGAVRALFNRVRKPKMVNFLSYRNQFLLLVKNLSFWDGLLALPWTLPYEIGKFLSVLVTEPWTLRAIPSALGLLPRMLGKRGEVARKRTVKGAAMRKWFT